MRQYEALKENRNVPASFLDQEGAMLATPADGEPLTPEHGWPLCLVARASTSWKSAKWLRRVELSAKEERYGF